MSKLFILFSLLHLTLLYAQSINFIEEKYHDAIESTFTKTGIISFLDKNITVEYPKETTKLIYTQGFLRIEENNNSQTMTLEDKPEIELFFTLFKAIYFEDKRLLSSYFLEDKENQTFTLTPKALISSYIDKVRYKKENNKLLFLEIFFASQDRVRIEELD